MLGTLNKVMDYIEEHLTEELTAEEIARTSGIGDYHFRTVFYYLSGGISLSEYIRGRRLSQAGMALVQGESVTDVAYTYGYQSLDGFTRAFTAFSGMLPSEVRKKGVSKAYPKLSFKITVEGGERMDYRIEEKPACKIAGVSRRVPMQFEGVNNAIVELAKSITEEQRKEMHCLQNIEPYHVLNASYEADAKFMKEEGYLTHMIGVLTTKEDISEQLEWVALPASLWAVFPSEGAFPRVLQQTMASIYAHWLPSSDFELLELPSFSWSDIEGNTAKSEIWIPVKKRETKMH
ncbi:MAG: GyrI-like domain-containing protein [Sphaerochaeta sp.]